MCDVNEAADRIDGYLAGGFFRSIDVCGGEENKPVEAFLPLYRKAEQYGLVKRMHVGESGSADDVRRAVELLGLHEVHHGIHAASSGEVMLGYASGYRDHPVKLLYENGVPVTINTDDLLIFDSSIENEYLLLYRSGALTAGQLDEIRQDGLNPLPRQ